MKWYQKTWVNVLLIILVPPVGMLLARVYKPHYLTSIHNGMITWWLIVWGAALSLILLAI